ncbi:MAG: ATP-binding cassette domain-containing protein [Clostridiales bacterium]|nr:ATP-binding cassette domain-containing protein [Clostridiales bacterium]
MIEVTNLVKHYGDKKAVNDISFSIKDGELVGFLGPNGAGKSTTMNVITGYLSATAGSAKINGIDILEDPMEAKRHIGYLPEQPPLYMDMSVNEYLDFICDLKGVDRNRKGHISDICEQAGITGVYKRMVKNLSKGYKQRVGLAQALIGDPEVLILDEPTVGLDPIQIVEIRNVIKVLGKQRTVILSSHILPEVQAICQRVLVINKGRIVADDTPQNLSKYVDMNHRMQIRIAAPRDKAEALLRDIPEMGDVVFEGVVENETCDFLICSKKNADIRRLLFNTCAKAGYPILMLNPLSASLEDIFIKLTEKDAEASKEA